MVAVPDCQGRPLTRVAASLLAGMLLLGAPVSAAAQAPAANPPADVDALWAQTDGVRPDSAFYVVQLWWNGIAQSGQRDPAQRGLQSLQQANTDLLDAYSLLLERRTDPGPHPVPVIDPILSGLYSLVTGAHPRAPLGSAFAWINQRLLDAEGRGSAQAIVESLLRDFGKRQSDAARDLALRAELAPVLAANTQRQRSLLHKIRAISDPGVRALVAQVEPPALAASKKLSAAPSAPPGRGQQSAPATDREVED